MSRGRGQPTKYRPKYCKEIIKFFNIQPTKTVKKTVIGKGGVQVMEVEVPNRLPTVEGFAIAIGVNKDTVIQWTKDHPEFSVAYARAKDHQKEVLNQNALFGLYVEGYSKFVAINCTDMVDKVSVDHHMPDLPEHTAEENKLFAELAVERARIALAEIRADQKNLPDALSEIDNDKKALTR
jgi:hypothetical protein